MENTISGHLLLPFSYGEHKINLGMAQKADYETYFIVSFKGAYESVNHIFINTNGKNRLEITYTKEPTTVTAPFQ